MKDGEIMQRGRYEDLITEKGNYLEFIKSHTNDESKFYKLIKKRIFLLCVFLIS